MTSEEGIGMTLGVGDRDDNSGWRCGGEADSARPSKMQLI